MKLFVRVIAIVLVAAASLPVAVSGREFNDRLLNRPYSDLRRWHLGFSVGVQTQDVRFTHNGFVTE